MNEHIEKYLKFKWPDGLVCPLCEETEWASMPDGPHVLEGQPMQLDGWAPPVGVFVLFCTGCGYVILLFDDIVLAVAQTAE